jgi:hypothetical protein
MKKALKLLSLSLLLWACQRNLNTTNEKVKKAFCGVDVATTYDSYLNKIIELQTKFPIKNKKKLVFGVKVFYVSSDNNSLLSNTDLETAFTKLNATFQSINLQFKQEGQIHFIKQDLGVDDLYGNLNAENEFTAPFYDTRYLNLFIMAKYEQVVGYTHYPMANVNRIFIAEEKLNDPSLVHEFGHFFGLLHTFESTLSTAEMAFGKNCKTDGDKICDTPPDPYGASFIEDDCTLFGEYKDEKGDTFKPDLSNFMSYYGRCRSGFSTEQLERIYFIAFRIKYSQMMNGV